MEAKSRKLCGNLFPDIADSPLEQHLRVVKGRMLFRPLPHHCRMPGIRVCRSGRYGRFDQTDSPHAPHVLDDGLTVDPSGTIRIDLFPFA
jgi:hypothetical protein